jgi:hypothetical protein
VGEQKKKAEQTQLFLLLPAVVTAGDEALNVIVLQQTARGSEISNTQDLHHHHLVNQRELATIEPLFAFHSCCEKLRRTKNKQKKKICKSKPQTTEASSSTTTNTSSNL